MRDRELLKERERVELMEREQERERERMREVDDRRGMVYLILFIRQMWYIHLGAIFIHIMTYFHYPHMCCSFPRTLCKRTRVCKREGGGGTWWRQGI